MSLAKAQTRERTIDGKFLPVHGSRRTSLYGIWSKAKGRCENPTDVAYSKYGARGITMCERWRNSFENFAKDMGQRPAGLSLERKNNDGPYSPENCKWGTKTEQANNRRSNRVLELNGERHSIAEWARILGTASQYAIAQRVNKLGWSDARALTTPTNRRAA